MSDVRRRRADAGGDGTTFSMCFREHIPDDVDLVLIELCTFAGTWVVSTDEVGSNQ